MPAMGIEQNVSPASSHLITERKGKTMPSVGIYRPPGARRINPQEETIPEVKSVEKPKAKQKQRRPDIQVYVPRAKRTSTGSLSDASFTSATSVPDSRQPSEPTETTALSRHAVPQPCDQGALISEPVKVKYATTPSKCNKEDSNSAVYLSHVETNSLDCVELNPKEAHYLRTNEEVQRLDTTSEEQITKIEVPVQDCDSFNSVSVSPVTEIYCRDESCSDTDTISDSVINSLQADCENYVKCSSNDFININIRTETPTLRQPVVNTNIDDIRLQPVNCEVENITPEYPVHVNSSCLVEILPSNEREQKCEDEQSDIGRNREEQNRKNRSIQRGNIKYLSDVLVISDVDPSAVNSITDDSLIVPSETSRLVAQACDSEERKCKSDDKGVSHSTSRLNPDECTWDMMFDDSGDCLDPFLLEELTSKVGNVSIKTPRSDYKNYTTVRELQPADSLAHIIEIYNFPAEFKTQDLMSIFSGYQSRGFEIKWVDDTHALGVFGNSVVADEVLEATLPFVKTRRLADGIAESRAKARRSSEFLQPYRARPETCPALARRLVTSALGVKLSTARQEREAEKALLKVARDKKKLVARLKDAAWEGTLESTLSNAE